MDFCKRAKRGWLFWKLLLFLVFSFAYTACAAESETDEAYLWNGMDGNEAEKSYLWDGQTESELNILESFVDLETIQSELSGLSDTVPFSFSDTVKSLLTGELSFKPDELPGIVSGLLFSEIRQQKQMVLQILAVVLASAVFANFVKVFDSSQIADISFYMMYLLISTMLIRAFLSMNTIVEQTCDVMNRFMKVLLPSYLVTVVLCSGTVTALGFYEITVIGMNLLQVLIIRIILPAVNFYLLLLILNQLSEDDYFSRFAQLAETVICWTTKTVLGVVVGLQAVQCLISPAVDSMKNSAVHQLAKAIPGIGSVIDSAAETVAGSAVVLKNAVGVAGILALAVLCLLPLVKLVSCILLFRILCAFVQPISDKRMTECIDSISKGTVLLLRVLVCSLAIFIISLTMITASVR